MFGFFYFDKFFIRKFVFLLFFLFLVALLDVFSLAMLPFMFLMLKDYNYFFSILSKVPFNFSAYQTETIIFFFCLLTLTVFIFKSILFFLYNFFNLRFCEKIKIDLVKYIFSRYINISYLDLKKEENSNLQNNIFFESEQLKLFVSETLLVLKEIFIIIFFIVTFFFFTKSSIIFFIFLLFIPNIILLIVTGNKVKKYIYKIHSSQSLFIKSINEGMNSLKESRIYNLSNIFLDQIQKNISKIEYNTRWLNLSVLNLKTFIELIIVFILVFIVLFNELSELNNSKVLFNILMLLVAIYRLFPSINIFNSLILKLSLRKKSFNNLRNFLNYKYFKINNSKKTSLINFSKSSILKISNCNFKYDDRSKLLFNNINFKKKMPISLAIMGSSGSGKSTLLDIIMGLIKPTSGGVYFNKKNIYNLGIKWIYNISYVGQKPFLLDDSIKNNIIFGDRNYNEELFKKVIDATQLKRFIQSLPNKESTLIGENGKFLSGGQAQRIVIARALYKNKPILILDEATNSVDSYTEKKIINNIRKFKKDIFIFTTHKLENYGKSNKYIKINN